MDIRAQLQAHLGSAFSVERELGGGGMSRVFVASETRLNRRVAIKVLSPELAQGLNVERFEREILMAASLQQANIVPLLAAGDLDGLPYFTMPFIEGESLRHRLAGGALPISEVLTILKDVARALEYAHARGIVHRDIKPDNVLLSGSTAVVTDFGIAKALAESQRPEGSSPRDLQPTLTQLGTSIGTPAYMAPEQVAGDPDIDHRVDLYALGCVAFELLTGKAPFTDRSAQRVLAAHLSETPAPVETQRTDCPPSIALLVARLLEKDPADRPTSAADVLRVLDEMSTSANSAPSPVMAGPNRLPRMLLMWAGATVATAVLVQAAVVGVGLPEWTFTGAIAVMLLGLPIILATGYIKQVSSHSTTSAPQGTMARLAIKASPHVSWRRAWRLKVGLVSTFVVLVAGFMVTRALGIGPAGSLFAAGTLAADDRIVLADFTAAAEDSALAPIVQSAVREALSQSRVVRVLSPTDVVAALGEMRLPNTTPLDATVARDLALRTQAKAILGGRLVSVGNGFLVSLELVSAEQGAILASFQGTANQQEDLLTTVDELTRKLRSKVGESLKSVANSVPLERATTPSLEALRLFTEATRANDIDGDYDRSVRLLREALAFDSTFALAWRKLSASLRNARAPRSSVDSALERSAQYADRLPPLERHLVEGSMYDLHSSLSDRARSLAAYKAAYAIDSTLPVVHNQIMLVSLDRGEYDTAIAYARKQVRVEPGLSSNNKLMRALLMGDRLDVAATVLDSVLRVSPGDTSSPFVQADRIGIAYARGDFGDALSIADQMARSSQIPSRLTGLGVRSELELATGRVRRSLATAARVDSIQASRGALQLDGALGPAATAILFTGDPTAGVERLDRLVASPSWQAAGPSDRPYFTVAELYARAGVPSKGRAMLQRMAAEWPEGYASKRHQAWRAVTEGWLALAEGDAPRAIERFRAGVAGADGRPAPCEACAMFGLATAFDAAQQPDSARVHLENYLAVAPFRRLRIADPVALAATRKRLGELYDAKGERAKAIEQYQAFVDQWADADPELQPSVTSVRKRIEELKQQGG